LTEAALNEFQKSNLNINLKLKILPMFLTPHAATGIYIGSQIPNAWLAFLFGFISHLLLDFIPHGDESLGERWNGKIKVYHLALISGLDMIVVGLLTYYLIANRIVPLTPAVLAGLAGSILPDYIWGLHEITKDKVTGWISSNILSACHHLLPVRLPLKVGVIIQLTTLLIFMRLLTI